MKVFEILSDHDSVALKNHGLKVIDNANFDSYHLTLVKMPMKVHGSTYQIGFAKTGTSFTDYSQHNKKYSNSADTKDAFKNKQAMINQIKAWVQEYGPIAISSSSKSKTLLYTKILKDAGLHIEHFSDSSFGPPVSIIK